MSSFALAKSGLKTALTQALYNDIISNTNGYYYFIGKTLEWSPLFDDPQTPLNTIAYENDAREKIIFMKKVNASDVAFTIPRYDWIQGEVFDMYDDQVGKEVEVQVTPTGANFLYLDGTFDMQEYGVGWLVEGAGIAPDTYIELLTPTQITLSKRTVGNVTTIRIVKLSTTGIRSLDNSKFYCLTNERNVYKCLDNNNGAPSTSKPFSTTHLPIKTEDGYVWKFMYTVPGSFQNKFTSLSDIPVTTAVKSAFYSQGSISSVVIENSGEGYESGDVLVVTGDGHLRDNIFRVLAVIADNPGSGYTFTPTVSVNDPFDAVTFETETDYLTGQYLKTEERIYQVSQGGTTGTTPPTHTSIVSIANGSTFLKFVGLAVNATAEIVDGAIDNVSLAGVIGFVNVNTVGSGYDPEIPPTVTIIGDGVGATAVATVSGAGTVTGVTVVNRGSGYTNAVALIDPPVSGEQAAASVEVFYGFGYLSIPLASIEPPYEADSQWTALGLVAENEIISVGQRFYQVTSTGVGQTLGPTVPIHITGTELNGECDLLFLGETASLSVFTEKTRARLTPVIEDGQIVNVIINDPGVGYTVADVTAAGVGTGAIFTPNISQGDLNTRQANTELLAIPGSIEAIDVLNPGVGYVWATVTIDGDGVGCEATAVLDQGAIKKINITNSGSGYTKATATITGNAGATQAYARVIISPFGGHGKNAVNELFAKDIVLSTTIARDRNQGFIINNDYRQLGIIRDPRRFNSTQKLTDLSGSTCFVVTGNFNYNLIENDMDILDTNNNKYRVIGKALEAPSEGQLTSVLVQSLDNKIPVNGTVFVYAGSQQAIITSVVNPTVNKYSGEMMFIDNRASFQPTDEQTIAIKTVIRL